MDTGARPDADEAQSPPLVVIGVPTERIDALLTLLSGLPAAFPAPIVIGQYRDADDPVQLAEMLTGKTDRPVVVVSGEIPLQPGTIYVGSSGQDFEFGGVHEPGTAQSGNASMSSVDRLMASAARIYSDQLIGVLMAGQGLEGLAGAQAIKAYGGTVILEDRVSVDVIEPTVAFPLSAVDIVATLGAIGPLLGDLLSGLFAVTSVGEPAELEVFLERIREQSGIDFRAYKQPTIERRLRRRMTAVGVDSLKSYLRYVDRHPEELQQLISSFLIKVTHFFRDPDLFLHLREKVLPDLVSHAVEHDRELRIWSAGCATGEEAYSVAMIVLELLGDDMDRLPVRIFATDIASDAVDFARHGVYPSAALAEVPAEMIERHFDRLDGAFAIKKPVRSLVVFGEHDLGRRPPFPRIDLALCRNVLIYFTSELQRRALQRFAFSVRPGGILVLGKAESVSPLPEYFALERPRLKIYRRNETVSPVLTNSNLAPAPAVATSPTMARRYPVRRLASSSLHSAIVPPLTEQAIQVLDRLSVGVIVVDRSYDIRAINVAARRLLDIRGAGIGEDLIHQVAQSIGAPLRRAVDDAFRGEPSELAHRLPPDVAHEVGRDLAIICTAVPVKEAVGVGTFVQIEVTDVTRSVARERVLTDEENRLSTERNEIQKYTRETGDIVRDLREANDSMAAELGHLRADNEQLQLAHEEVQAAGEEIETLNEEQQAANEELETLNEELQATVEELNTANGELQARAVQLEALAATLEGRRQESEAWFNAIVEEAFDYAIFTVDADRTIDSWTPGAETIFGWTTKEAVNQPFDLIFTPEDRLAGVPEREFEAARETGVAQDTRWHMRRDGTRVFVDGSSRARHNPDGEFSGLLKIGRNVTELHLTEQRQQQAEDEARMELERRVSEATTQSRLLSRKLLEVQDEERRRLALELHDEIGQTLTGLQFQLGAITTERPIVAEAQETVRQLTELVRQLSMDLRPAALGEFGLLRTLDSFLERFQRITGIAIDFRNEGADQRYLPLIEITAYRLVQETLTNVARHAEATAVTVHLSIKDETLRLDIRDNGKGFDPESAEISSGLNGMRDRVSLLNGTLVIESSPGSGARVLAELSLEAPSLTS
jgi:PAS domain S-box-containing protein